MDFNLYFRSRRGEMLSLLKELVHLESPTSDKRAVDACSTAYVERFRGLGAKISRLSQKAVGDFHLIEYPGRADTRLDGRLLVLGHIDTVWPVGRLAAMPFFVSEDKVFGPGALDMKAGLVLAYAAIKALREINAAPRRRIALFVNSAEETGCAAAYDVVRAQARAADRVLCLEPALPGGALKLERKGRVVVRVAVKGRAAHGGTPEKGINAIDELLNVVRRVEALRAKETSVNVGLIGGGEKPNVVPDAAWAVFDIRTWTAARRDLVLARIRALEPRLRGAKIKVSVESLTPPMEKTRASARLFEEVRQIAAGLGLDLRGGRTGGGSDASIAAALGRPTVDGLGPDGDGLHAAHEHVLLPSLVVRAALLTELFRRL